jgi:2-phosphosulfolactate phosphatase
MRIDVAWTTAELEHFNLHERAPVVVDVLRAASSIATAIHNGARAVLPAESIEEALRIANSIGRRDVVLCGEREGEPIEGFDLGNSPSEFTRQAVGERTLVMTTTNGTRALAAAAGPGPSCVAALVNLGAVSTRLLDGRHDPLIVCAGRSGRVAAEDALCAGLLVMSLLERGGQSQAIELGDGAIAALALAERHSPVGTDFLMRTAAGRALAAIGAAEDVALCARVDALSVVPVLAERQISGFPSSMTTGGRGRFEGEKLSYDPSGG